MYESRTCRVVCFLKRSEHDCYCRMMWCMMKHVERVKLRRGKIWRSVGSAMVVAIILSGCKTAPDTSAARTSNPAVDMSVKVQALQKEIRERDKRIEELESQLNTLKLIEQDFEKQKMPIRPPATLRPIE